MAAEERQETEEKQRDTQHQVQELRCQDEYKQWLGVLISHVARTCNREQKVNYILHVVSVEATLEWGKSRKDYLMK